MPSANQNIFDCIYKEPCDTKNYYSKTNIAAEDYAMKVLKGNAFKVWRFFSKQNPAQFKNFASYGNFTREHLNMTQETFNNSCKELLNLGFLVQKSKTHFEFYETPQKSFSKKENFLF